jgi:hypothetical protein
MHAQMKEHMEAEDPYGERTTSPATAARLT